MQQIVQAQERNLQQAEQLIVSLLPFVQLAQAHNRDVGLAEQLIVSLLPFVQLAQAHNRDVGLAEQAIESLLPFVPLSQQLEQQVQYLENAVSGLLTLYTSPDFLIPHAFDTWKANLQPQDTEAIRWLSERFLDLMQGIETPQQQQQFPTYESPLAPTMAGMQVAPGADFAGMGISQQPQNLNFQAPNQQILAQQQRQMGGVPLPPPPGGATRDPMAGYRDRIELLKSGNPSTQQILQQQHTQRLMAMGVGGGGW